MTLETQRVVPAVQCCVYVWYRVFVYGVTLLKPNPKPRRTDTDHTGLITDHTLTAAQQVKVIN